MANEAISGSVHAPQIVPGSSYGAAQARSDAAVTLPPASERPLPASDNVRHDAPQGPENRPHIQQANVKDGGFAKAVKDNWKEFGIGAPFKAVSDVLVKDPSQPMSKAGIIGWIKVLISLPMEIAASTLGFFSGLVTNTGPEIKSLFSKTEKDNKPAMISNPSPPPARQEGPAKSGGGVEPAQEASAPAGANVDRGAEDRILQDDSARAASRRAVSERS